MDNLFNLDGFIVYYKHKYIVNHVYVINLNSIFLQQDLLFSIKLWFVIHNIKGESESI